MKCSHIQSLFSEYLDGQLSAAQADLVERHLTACDGCQSRWRMLRRTVRLVAHLGQEKCPVDLRARVALAVAGSRPKPAFRFPLPLAAVSGVATGLAALGVLAALFRPGLTDGLPEKLKGETAAVVAEAPETAAVHDQVGLAQGMGLDGLLLALPPDEAREERARLSGELVPRTHKNN